MLDGERWEVDGRDGLNLLMDAAKIAQEGIGKELRKLRDTLSDAGEWTAEQSRRHDELDTERKEIRAWVEAQEEKVYPGANERRAKGRAKDAAEHAARKAELDADPVIQRKKAEMKAAREEAKKPAGVDYKRKGETTYRGEGEGGDSRFYEGVPIVGEGKYSAFDKDIAGSYGDTVSEGTLDLDNPLVLTNDKEWAELTKEAGWKYPNPLATDKPPSKEEMSKMAEGVKQAVLARGHDGLVVDLDDALDAADVVDGERVTTLRDMFAHGQVVDYRGTGEARKPDKGDTKPDEGDWRDGLEGGLSRTVWERDGELVHGFVHMDYEYDIEEVRDMLGAWPDVVEGETSEAGNTPFEFPSEESRDDFMAQWTKAVADEAAWRAKGAEIKASREKEERRATDADAMVGQKVKHAKNGREGRVTKAKDGKVVIEWDEDGKKPAKSTLTPTSVEVVSERPTDEELERGIKGIRMPKPQQDIADLVTHTEELLKFQRGKLADMDGDSDDAGKVREAIAENEAYLTRLNEQGADAAAKAKEEAWAEFREEGDKVRADFVKMYDALAQEDKDTIEAVAGDEAVREHHKPSDDPYGMPYVVHGVIGSGRQSDAEIAKEVADRPGEDPLADGPAKTAKKREAQFSAVMADWMGGDVIRRGEWVIWDALRRYRENNPLGAKADTKAEKPKETRKTAQPKAARPADYGSKNKVVSTTRYEELKKRMAEKMNTELAAGFDPELMAIGAEMAAYHVEAGARKFADVARALIADLGDGIKPYLKAIYNGAKDMPGMEEYDGDMDEADTVRDLAKRIIDGEVVWDDDRAGDGEGDAGQGGTQTQDEGVVEVEGGRVTYDGTPERAWNIVVTIDASPDSAEASFKVKELDGMLYGRRVGGGREGYMTDDGDFQDDPLPGRVMGERKRQRRMSGGDDVIIKNAGAWVTKRAKWAKAMGDLARADQAAKADGDTIYGETIQGIEDLPKDRNVIKKHIAQLRGVPVKQIKNSDIKQAYEEIEAAVVRIARGIVAEGNDLYQRTGDRAEAHKATYDKLLDLYARQPVMGSRTGDSAARQAYSTPVPLAYLTNMATGLGANTSVYEPTAGTGMLLIGADPENAHVNEIDPLRRKLLEEQGFDNVTGVDASKNVPVIDEPVDVVITNPPFGKLEDEAGKKAPEKVDGYKIEKLDHLIAAKALGTMADDGKAAIIVGANMMKAGQISGPERQFMNWLNTHYNVVDNFELDGALYRRQGAGYPVRVIVVHGRRATPDKTKVAPVEVDRIDNWRGAYERIENLGTERPDESGGADRTDDKGQGQTDTGDDQQPTDPETQHDGDGRGKDRPRDDKLGDEQLSKPREGEGDAKGSDTKSTGEGDGDNVADDGKTGDSTGTRGGVEGGDRGTKDGTGRDGHWECSWR